MSVHGEMKEYKLSEEERLEIIKKYGKPTYPLNHFRSRFYMTDPTKKRDNYGGFKEGVKF